MKKFVLFFLLVLIALPVLAQTPDTVVVYRDVIKTDTVYVKDSLPLVAPDSVPSIVSDTLIANPGPVIIDADAKETINWFGYLIAGLVVIGTLFSGKLSENASKLSTTILGVLGALKVIVDSAMANGGLGNIKPEAVAIAVTITCLGILAPSLLDSFPWLKDIIMGLFKKKK